MLTRASGPVIAALAVVGTTAACGGGGSSPADPATIAAGAGVFREAGCGTCHTLAAAGSRGRIGPSLDGRSLSPDEVADQVSQGGNGMPAFSSRLSEQQIDAVAAYVAKTAGREAN